MEGDNENPQGLSRLLDVKMVGQDDLEKDLNAQLDKTLKQKEEEIDQKRLEKSEKKLDLLVSKAKRLQAKYDSPYTKISEKQYLQKQIKELENGDIHEIKQEIEEIKQRKETRKREITQLEDFGSGSNSDEQLPGESKRDFLVRTGRITAFGSSSGFKMEEGEEIGSANDEKVPENVEENVLEEDNQEKIEQKGADNDDYVPGESEEVDSDILEQEMELEQEIEIKEEEEEGEEVEELRLDDGDENYYKQRISKWNESRKEIRERHNISNNENKEECFIPHPEFKDAVLNKKYRVPGEIFGHLFDYQKTCVQWLWELYCQRVGGIIGDEMGLGKTIQVISYLAGLQYSGLSHKPILIVCPSTVMRQWVNEFHTWWAPFRVSILHSIGSAMHSQGEKSSDFDFYELVEDDDHDNEIKKSLSSQKMQNRASELVKKAFSAQDPGRQVIVTTYQGLSTYSSIVLKRKWGYAILDEGHKIRNPNANLSLAAKQIKTPNRIILSGTPIQNNLTELWSLFDFVYPGKLGTLPVFQREFVVPINMGGYANASNIQVQTSYRCAVALKNLIGPYLLRRLKVDVAKDLPNKTEMVLFCKLTAYQQRKYIDFLKSEDTEKVLSRKKHALFGIDVLKKICNHPDLVLLKQGVDISHKKNFGDPSISGKMQVLKTLVPMWIKEGHKILLFTQTRQMLDILEKFIRTLSSQSEINYSRMDGTTPVKIRQELMDTFNNNPSIGIFLLTTRVGGLGVNLIGADRVIIFDPDWNPSTDLQARERAWRLGQKRDVTIYRLMSKGTIEEKIYQRQIFKQYLSNKVLKDPNQKRVFKMNELNDLFTYGNEDDDDDNDYRSEKYFRNPNYSSKIPQPKAKTDDFAKVAEISGVAQLMNYQHDDDSDNSTKKNTDDSRILGSILEGNGIKAVIQDDDDNSNSQSVIEREAEKVANEAVSNILKSRKLARSAKIGTPTWTGQRGSAGKVSKSSNFSSSSVLKNLKERKKGQTSSHSSFKSNLVENKEKIVETVRRYLVSKKDHFAKSQEIIGNIDVQMDNQADVQLIRSILRQIANWDATKSGWTLKREFGDLI